MTNNLVDFLNGKLKNVCDNCKFFIKDKDDPMNIGGTCTSTDTFCFCYQTCNKFFLKTNKKDKDIVVSYESEYKCPICNEHLIKYKTQFTSSPLSCKNNCFEKLQKKYCKCPICHCGFMNNISYHGTSYLKCSNKNCGYEINPLTLISLILHKFEKED